MDFVLLNATTSALGASSTSKESLIFWVLIVIGVIVLISCLQYIMKSRSTVANPTNVATTNATQTAIFQTKFTSEFKDKKSLLQAIQAQNVSENEMCLINFQPLTVIHPGYLGPIQDGVYNEKEGVDTAIRMGARCFVLPIDYHTKETMGSTFPPPNKPCLLFRDESGTVRSINGGSIAKVAQAIADVAWSNVVNQRNDPFILVLYFMRTPDQGTKDYLDFLSQVAVDLAPLSPYLLGQTPEGVYNRQARQDQLLFVNVTQLEKKLLIFCNVDTSGFRTAKKDFNKSYLPKEDLDYWVHMRIFKQNTETPLGMTDVPERTTVPRSMLETLSYYTTLPSDQASKRTAITATKEKFMIALTPQGKNPELASATSALDTYGVQSVPLLITEYSSDVRNLLAKWKYAWKAKPKELRYVRPAPIGIQTQSSATNANGGRITIPS
jgi:hypothetical protein